MISPKGDGGMKIHLYAIRLDRPLTEEEVQTLTRLMPPQRRERLARLPREELCYEPLCAYAALYHGLRKLYGWKSLPRFRYAEYGKPEFDGYPEVQFNISHTRGAVLVGIHDKPIGVDIECIRPMSERMMQRIAGTSSPGEFFENWVRRESRGKWGGSGLAAMQPERSPALAGERFCFVDTFPGYVACVCTHSQDECGPVECFTLK